MKLPCTLKLRHTGSDTKGGGVGPMVTENLSCTLAAAVQDQTLITGGGTLCYDGYNQRGHKEVSMTLRSAMTGTEGNDADPKVAIGFKAGQSKDGVKCYDPYNNTESEATPTIRSNAGVSTAGPLAYGADLSQMRYIVRRLTPKECERLMGLPDGYTIPTGLRRFFDANGEPSPELVAEFQRTFDTFGAIMADYAHAKPPKPKSAKQVADWLKKISDHATCPDSPRYKGCGNGWATNQPRWILCRLLAADGVDPFGEAETD